MMQAGVGTLLVYMSFVHPVLAQGVDTRTISSIAPGYCFTDTDNDKIFTDVDYPVKTPNLSGNLPATDAHALPITVSGVIDETYRITKSFRRPFVHVPNTLGTGGSYLPDSGVIGTGGLNYDLDISDTCIGSVSRTDTVRMHVDDDNDPLTPSSNDDGVIGADPITSSTQRETSPSGNYYDDDGFSFGGNFVMRLIGQIKGNVLFDNKIGDRQGITQDGDVTFTLAQNTSEIFGVLSLEAARNVVVTLNGKVTTLSMLGANNVRVTNSARIGSALLNNITGNLLFTNSGYIPAMDVSGSEFVTLNFLTGSTSDVLRANNMTGDMRLTNAGTIATFTTGMDLSVLLKPVTMSITNSGKMESETDSAVQFRVGGTATGAGRFRILFNNSGTVSAASSDTFDFVGMTGSLMNLTNSGVMSASISRVINGSNAGATVTINNTGTIGVSSSQAILLNSVTGEVSVTNGSSSAAGKITAGTSTVDFTGSSNVTLRQLNRNSVISATSNKAIIADGSALFNLSNEGSISAGGERALSLIGAGNATISMYGANSRLRADDNYAIISTDLTGNLSLHNEGVIEAKNKVADFSNAGGKVALTNSATMRANHARSEANLGTNFVLRATRDQAPTGATVDVTNSGSITTNSDNAILLENFTRANDKMSITNSGTIAAGRLNAVRLNGVKALTLTNSGTIRAGAVTPADATQSGNKAVNIFDAQGNISIINSGLIESAHRLADADSTATENYALSIFKANGQESDLVLASSGTIKSSSDYAVRIQSYQQDADSIQITNSGTISTARDYAIDVSGNKFLAITNSGTISAGNKFAVNAANAGNATLTNSGANSLISAVGDFAVYANGAVNGFTFSNAGTVRAANFAVSANGTRGAVKLTNSGVITASNMALSASGGTGNVTLTNSGVINATGAVAIDLSNSASATLTNDGTISAKGNTLDADGISGVFIIINNANGKIISSGEHAVFAAGVANASLTNHGTVTAVSGTNVKLDGSGVTLINNGLISGGSIVVELGSRGSLTNNGTIAAGSITDTAIKVIGTSATINMNADSKIIGTIDAADVTNPADRHTINISFVPSLSYAFDFDENKFVFKDSHAAMRSTATGSAHGASASLFRAGNTLAARRALALSYGYNESAQTASRIPIQFSLWQQNASRKKTTKEPFSLEESAIGAMVNVVLPLSIPRRIELLLAHDIATTSIANKMQELESTYTGFGAGMRNLAKFGNFNLSGYLLLGVSENESKRVVVSNKVNTGRSTVKGNYDAAHLDARVAFNYGRPLRVRGLRVDTRLGFGVSIQSNDGFDEGTYYRVEGHDVSQQLAAGHLRLTYDNNEGYLPNPENIHFQISGFQHTMLKGRKLKYKFLDPKIVSGANASMTDNVTDETGTRFELGYERYIDHNSGFIQQRYIDSNMSIKMQISQTRTNTKRRVNEGGISLLVPF